MSEEKKINIEDGDLEEAIKEETMEQPNSIDEETVEQDEQEVENEEESETQEEEEKDPLEAAQEENAKLRDQLLRTIAEFENYKKRTLKEKAELILNGGEKTITAILPVLDDFERALADNNTDDPAAIKEGMYLIFKKFIKTLEALGVKKSKHSTKTSMSTTMKPSLWFLVWATTRKGKSSIVCRRVTRSTTKSYATPKLP